jgi:hypothetical protein
MASQKVQALVQVIRKAQLSREELRQLEEMVFQLQSRTSQVSGSREVKEFPPRMPVHYDDLNRAICLLGNRITSDLGNKAQKELVNLIGVYPDLEQASRWKQSLTKKLRESADLAPVTGNSTQSEDSEQPDYPARSEQPRTTKLSTRTAKSSVRTKRESFQKPEKQKLESSQKKVKLPLTFDDAVAEAEYMFRIGLGHLVDLDSLGDED